MDKSYRTKYAERLNKKKPWSNAGPARSSSGPTGDDGKASGTPNYKVFDNLTRLMKERHEQNMKHLSDRCGIYVEHYFELMNLKYQLAKLKMENQRMDSIWLDSSSEERATNLCDEYDALFDDQEFNFGREEQRKTKKKSDSKFGNQESSTNDKKTSQKGFSLYNKYNDHSAELDLESGLFSIQVDVGGSKDNEILIDSKENHLTVKSKDSSGKRHTFGIICPSVDEIEKLYIHYPKDGILTIDGPKKEKTKNQQQQQNKKTRTVHM